MSIVHHAPRTALSTHAVTNQAAALVDRNLFADDKLLRDLAHAAGAVTHTALLSAFGARIGSEEVMEWGDQANRNPPRLRAFDRYGRRIDEVEFHPDYHRLMELSLTAGASSIAWRAPEAGHVAHSVLLLLLTQADAGHGCPVSMTYAAVAALRREPALAAVWEPRVLASRYDPACLPADRKSGVTLGMAMTEKQGGSDVRANTTRALPASDGSYEIFGHKWFCSAPMSDAFLTLARTDPDDAALTCFLAPRWRPDGERSPIEIQRLKDKLGDRSNASAEIEFVGAYGVRVGAEGRGIATILEMVQATRLDCVNGAAATARWALSNALWHTRRRHAFGRRLIEQPLMREVLADMGLEVAAAMALGVRLAACFDRAAFDARERSLARLLTPLAKYWVCKRCPAVVAEAMECLGGIGFVEESPLARAFRQSPLNSIWEGSGNVIALDLLRVGGREDQSVGAMDSWLRTTLSAEHRVQAAAALESLRAIARDPERQNEARWVTERLAKFAAGACLIDLGEPALGEAWLAARSAPASALSFGATPLSPGTVSSVLERMSLE